MGCFLGFGVCRESFIEFPPWCEIRFPPAIFHKNGRKIVKSLGFSKETLVSITSFGMKAGTGSLKQYINRNGR